MNKAISISLLMLLGCACCRAQSAASQSTIVQGRPTPSSPAPSSNVVQSNPAPDAAGLSAADISANKARQLLDQMVAALGGEAWLTYKTSTQQGRSYSFFHGKPTTEGFLFWRFFQYPDKERRELTKQ